MKHVIVKLTLKEAEALGDLLGNSLEDISDILLEPGDIAAGRRAALKFDKAVQRYKTDIVAEAIKEVRGR